MAIVKCKICGGEVDLPVGVTMGECPYCESMVTFPKQSSDRQMQLYQRAEQLRLAGSFDKAAEMYEAVIKEDPSDAEAYWGLLLSNWGIEYVEDPVTKERKPTCHRVQFDSILDDPDYRQTLENASPQEAEIYKMEAQRIAEIQKDILRISSQEEPFDVFICYKETDEKGERTRDSVRAQELYDRLTEEKYKVFFARITLEDKLGQQYEPYIFAALNSAKVMLVIGSKKEYFEAPWVRNEWNRFLRLMRDDKSKVIIPCYRDNADILPEELLFLQGKDMGSLSFVDDLFSEIKKIVGERKRKIGLKLKHVEEVPNRPDAFAGAGNSMPLGNNQNGAASSFPAYYADKPKKKKSKFLAMLLSFLLPGLGHIYLGQVGKGFGIIIGLVALGFVLGYLDLDIPHGPIGTGIAVGVMLNAKKVYDEYYG